MKFEVCFSHQLCIIFLRGFVVRLLAKGDSVDARTAHAASKIAKVSMAERRRHESSDCPSQ